MGSAPVFCKSILYLLAPSTSLSTSMVLLPSGFSHLTDMACPLKPADLYKSLDLDVKVPLVELVRN